MNSIERRIERAERFVGIKEEEPVVLILGLDFGETAPHFPEPADEWLTFKKALEETRRLRQCALIFQVNPWSEYEVRHGLEPGMLAGHELCGKVPFAELLAAATGAGRTSRRTAIHDGLSRRVRELRKQTGADERFVSFSLPGRSGRAVTLPRSLTKRLEQVGKP